VKENLSLSFSKIEKSGRIEIEIFDVPGNRVYQTNVEHYDEHIILPTSNLSAGFYFIKISSGDKKGIARFSKVN
jgi:hypothetical protein